MANLVKMSKTGGPELIALLTKWGNKARTSTRKRIVVQYGADYSVYVHEDLEMPHPRGGQAKFLEAAIAKLAPETGPYIAKQVAKGIPLEDAMMAAGFKIQVESQKLCPVDTGNLRASATTTIETKPG